MPEPTWRQRYPHPGRAPEKPSEREPLTLEHQDDWFLRRFRWNQYVQKLRKHEMACALDQLEAIYQVEGKLHPEQVIARNVAALVLDGTLLSESAEMAQLLTASRR